MTTGQKLEMLILECQATSGSFVFSFMGKTTDVGC